MEERDIVYGEKIKLDHKDKKILSALYEDGRMSIASISKKTRIQRDSVLYRIKKMLREKAITFFLPIINPSKIGYPLINIVLIKTIAGDIEKEKKFISNLKNNRFITYIAIISGKWDYQIIICAKHPGHFNQVMKEIRSYLPSYISDFETSTIIKEPKYELMLDLID